MKQHDDAHVKERARLLALAFPPGANPLCWSVASLNYIREVYEEAREAALTRARWYAAHRKHSVSR